ncbi:hypothetical protein T09_13154 [Trichinella sp. T9]|nr:hypothetical protein T09_13154 [Trichinella sp. T9]
MSSPSRIFTAFTMQGLTRFSPIPWQCPDYTCLFCQVSFEKGNLF